MAIWKNIIGSTVMLGGHAAQKMLGLIQKLRETIKGQEKVNQAKLLAAVKVGFSEYIKTMLNSCDN